MSDVSFVYGYMERVQGRGCGTYLNQDGCEVQRQSVPQDGLNEHSQSKDVHPHHHGFAPSSLSESQSFTPQPLSVASNLVDFFAFFFAAILHVFVFSRRPSVLAAFVDEFCAVLLERRNTVESIFIV